MLFGFLMLFPNDVWDDFNDRRSELDPGRLAENVLARSAFSIALAALALGHAATRTRSARHSSRHFSLVWYIPVMVWALLEVRSLANSARAVTFHSGLSHYQWLVAAPIASIAALAIVLVLCSLADALALRQASLGHPLSFQVPLAALAPIASVALMWASLLAIVSAGSKS